MLTDMDVCPLECTGGSKLTGNAGGCCSSNPGDLSWRQPYRLDVRLPGQHQLVAAAAERQPTGEWTTVIRVDGAVSIHDFVSGMGNENSSNYVVPCGECAFCIQS